jgi:hypothetical protein
MPAPLGLAKACLGVRKRRRGECGERGSEPWDCADLAAPSELIPNSRAPAAVHRREAPEGHGRAGLQRTPGHAAAYNVRRMLTLLARRAAAGIVPVSPWTAIQAVCRLVPAFLRPRKRRIAFRGDIFRVPAAA